MLSFKNFIQDLITEAIQFDKYGDESGAVHHATDGKNMVSIHYTKMPTSMLGKPEKRMYNLNFSVNGQAMSVHNDPEIHHLAFHSVRHSIKEFVQDYKPSELVFEGNTKEKHHYWKKMGANLAGKLGAKFKPDEKGDSLHTMIFESDEWQYRYEKKFLFGKKLVAASHKTQIGPHSVEVNFHDSPAKRGHYLTIFNVDHQTTKHSYFNEKFGPSVFNHVRSKIHEFIDVHKPKGLYFKSNLSELHEMHQLLAKHLAKKYNGKAYTEPPKEYKSWGLPAATYTAGVKFKK